jgi:hypothetical protein
LDPSDYCHSASSAKNSDEKQVAVIPRKAKTKTRKQGKSNQAALKAGVARSIWETLSHTTGRPNRTERTMRKTRNALLGILTMMSGAILAVPTEAAERYIPGVHLYKAVPERFFSFPYGGSYLKRAKRAFGNPYVNPYYGSYYAPQYYYGNYRSPYYW